MADGADQVRQWRSSYSIFLQEHPSSTMDDITERLRSIYSVGAPRIRKFLSDEASAGRMVGTSAPGTGPNANRAITKYSLPAATSTTAAISSPPPIPSEQQKTKVEPGALLSFKSVQFCLFFDLFRSLVRALLSSFLPFLMTCHLFLLIDCFSDRSAWESSPNSKGPSVSRGAQRSRRRDSRGSCRGQECCFEGPGGAVASHRRQ